MTTIAYCRQAELGLIRVSGNDARSFLHAQLTQSIADLAPGRSVLAAWLNAKGRVRALFDVIAAGEDVLLVTAADNVEPTLGELRLFVLRAKVKLELLPELAVHAIVGDAAAWLEQRGVTLEPRAAALVDGVVWHRQGARLVQVVGEPGRVEHALAGLEPIGADAAELEAVRLGLPQMPFALRAQYIPQMLNLEQLGGVSFKKGCYPGQEIVARTENLGQVKRRLASYAVAAGKKPAAGASIVDASGAAVGEVNRAAPTADGFELLAVVRIEARDRRLELEDDGRTLQRLR